MLGLWNIIMRPTVFIKIGCALVRFFAKVIKFFGDFVMCGPVLVIINHRFFITSPQMLIIIVSITMFASTITISHAISFTSITWMLSVLILNASLLFIQSISKVLYTYQSVSSNSIKYLLSLWLPYRRDQTYVDMLLTFILTSVELINIF